MKLASTVELVRDHVAQDESVVVFFWERATATKFARALRVEAPVYVVHGEFAQEERESSVRQFQATGGVLAATFGALREGVTLHKANRLVLHDLDWTPANILQAERRVYRIGQTRPTFVTWMVAADTIDAIFAQALVEKARNMLEVLGVADMSDAARDTGLEALVPDDDVARLLEYWAAQDDAS